MEEQRNQRRRDFLKTASIGSLLLMGAPQILSAATGQALNSASVSASAKIALSQDDIILFQGDSITDSGRKRDNPEPNNSAALGNGYAFLAASALLKKHADKNLKIYNKGISGNKVYQLAERWDADCLELKPTVLSILIGVNDYWHKHNGKYDGTSKKYTDDLTALLDRTRQKLPEVKLIIAEPFAVKGVKAVDDTWYPEFDEYRVAAASIAKRFAAVYIPYQKVFDEAQKTAPGKYWTGDGVHPSAAGAELMAEAWLTAVK